MSKGSVSDRERIWPTYVVLAVVFLALVVAGVITVAMPELADDPERAPTATPSAQAPSPPAAPPR